MVTPEQIRAARAIVRMEQADLAARAGVSLGTIKRLEGLNGTSNAQESTLAGIKAALEGVGVMFLDDKEGTPQGGPGVRLALRQTEPTAEQIEWIRVHLREALAERINDRPVEQLRGHISGAIVDGLMLAQERYGERFPDSSGAIFGKAAGIIIAEITSGMISPAAAPKKQPRKHYDRTDPESGAGMKGSRPVARRAQVTPTSDDDE